MTIKGGTISGNSESPDGGGIYVQAGTVNLDNVEITGAKARIGGGIYNIDTLTITDTTINNNNATGTDVFDGGGGICTSDSANTQISGSTFNANTASFHGGGILASGTFGLVNSTISGNTATGGFGGGIGAILDGSVTLDNVTVSGNTAGAGGGIVVAADGTISVKNSIMASNTGDDFNNYTGSPGTVINRGYNIIGNSTDYACVSAAIFFISVS